MPEHCHLTLDPRISDGESVCARNNTSNSIMLSTGSPKGCALSPLLVMLLTHNCASRHKGNQIIKFVGDTTVMGDIHKMTHLCTEKKFNTLRVSAEKIIWYSMGTKRRKCLLIYGGHSRSTLLSASVAAQWRAVRVSLLSVLELFLSRRGRALNP